MMSTWRMHRHVASDEWKYGFRVAWIAAGGNENDLTNK